MEHVVFYPALDGAPAFRRFASLDDAVRFVEHLRNAEGVSEVSVHALSPVPVAFRAYYKVEVPQDVAHEPAHAAEVPAQSEPVAAEQLPSEPYDTPVADAVEPVMAEPVMAEPVMAEPVMAEPVMAEAAMAEAILPAGAPSPNGKRSLGFFAH
jgi:hypothetical protein